MKNALTPNNAKRLTLKAKKETNKFWEKHLLPSSDNLTLVLKTHLFVENLIDELLKATFPFSEKILEMRFSTKIILLESLGFETKSKILVRLKVLNRIRNNFAHKLNYKISREDIKELLGTERDAEFKNIKSGLIKGLVFIMGYLQALKTSNKTVPFLMAAIRNRGIYKNDKGFNITDIIATYEKHKIKEFFGSLKLDDK